jgi:hypothetical protein
MIGLGRPKSKLPEPSTNMKTTGKQDYMMEAMNTKKEKQPWLSDTKHTKLTLEKKVRSA